MIDIPLDFETYWDKDYKLDKMTTAEYICDPRFEIIGCSLRTPDGIDHWISGDVNHVRSELLRLVPDWSAVRVVAHNARFEAAILEWRLGIQAGAYMCTMVGSRPHLLPYTRSVSLDVIGRHVGAGMKGDFVQKMAGVHRTDMNDSVLADYGNYCKSDEKISFGIWDYLKGILPDEEIEVIDLTIKKYVRPRLKLSQQALVARLQDIDRRKEQLVALLEKNHGASLADIRSRTKFARLLELAGVEPPKKLNKKGNATFAFAKVDLEFKKLLQHPNVRVRELVAAKMALSSTLEESRVKRLLTLHDIRDGWLPVPLVYYGTHPGRLAGDEEINLQNLPRVELDKQGAITKGHLRYALHAPDGYSVVAADFSNIEARIVATLANEVELREMFRNNVDVYAQFATRVYGRPISKKHDPLERFVGKTCILGLNYGMGPQKFLLKMAQEGVPMDSSQAARIVQLYRSTYPGVPHLWRELEFNARTHMLKRDSIFPSSMAGMIFAHDRIILPNGMPIIYPHLAARGGALEFDPRFGPVASEDASLGPRNRIWGGMFLENVAQALARIIATRAELRLARRGLPAALQVHDELVWVVPTAIVEKVKSAIAVEMTRPVDFLPALPIAVEVKHGRTYGDAK